MFTGGPVWHHRDRRLIFSDIANDTFSGAGMTVLWGVSFLSCDRAS
jgi:hypothetical protein